MDGLNDIATSGAPAIVTALGMGTVFLCLILLYLTTRVIGSTLTRLLASADGRSAAAEPEATASAEVAASPDKDSAAGQEAIVAALTLVLARHRASRVASVADEPRGVDPWKIAGRIRTLRTR